MKSVRIGLIGDYNVEVPAHRAIPRALALAAASLSVCPAETEWLPTPSLNHEPREKLSTFDGLWCVPASPYASIAGALAGIRFARENRVPFLGTCGGFQHALLEFARNVLGLTTAEHAESSPATSFPLLARLKCTLDETKDPIFLEEGSRARQIYGRPGIIEAYRCSYGLNPDYEAKFSWHPLRFSGRDQAGEVRVFELNEHPFFVGTLFQPERSALRDELHPLICAYLHAVLEYSNEH
jgi:CTP synthase (UTP-ammonia lyase)